MRSACFACSGFRLGCDASLRRIPVPHFLRIGRAAAVAARGHALYWGRACCLAPGPVAQRLEPTAHNGLVGGSSPPGPTMILLNALTFGAALSFADYRNDRARAI